MSENQKDPVKGCLVIDRSGIILVLYELYSGALKSYLGVDLLEMSALIRGFDIFSQDLDEELEDVRFRDKIIYFIRIPPYFLTVIGDKTPLSEEIYQKIRSHFEKLIDANRLILEYVSQNGDVYLLRSLDEEGQQWLRNLNKFYHLRKKLRDIIDNIDKLFDEF
ncbi:MAG: hypothetical protein ACFFDN_41420 [Candidatus Hodarchaeota archaeon]